MSNPLLLWLLLGFLSRAIIAWGLPPGFDEAYYFLYTQHLDWSYFDHPIGVALTAGIGPWLTGYISPLTLRLGALLLYIGSTLLLYLTGRHLWGPKVGERVVAIATLSPLLFISFGILASPDSSLIFFWSAVLYTAALEFFPQKLDHSTQHLAYRPTYRIVLIGVLLALACLGKYHGFVLGLSLVGFCLTSPPHRRALWSPWLVASLLLFGLCLAPLWVWNLHHDWISFGFHLSARFDHNEPTPYNPLNVLITWLIGVGYLFPTLGFPLWWITARTLFSRKYRARVSAAPTVSQPQTFILWMGLPIAVGFTLLGGLTQIYPAWPAPGLWSLSLLLALASTHWSDKNVRRWLTSTGLIIGSLLLIALSHLTLGTFQKPGHFALFGGGISPKNDPTTSLIDVVQLRHRLAANDAVTAALLTTDLVVTPEFWFSGYIDMAISPLTPAPVTAFTQDPRGHALWFNPADWLNQTSLFITIADFDQTQIRQTYSPYFSQFDLLDTVSTQRGGEVTETFYVYQTGKLIRAYEYPY